MIKQCTVAVWLSSDSRDCTVRQELTRGQKLTLVLLPASTRCPHLPRDQEAAATGGVAVMPLPPGSRSESCWSTFEHRADRQICRVAHAVDFRYCLCSDLGYS